MDNSNLLFESIFKRKLSAPDTQDFLSQITKEYPYFSHAHFFLLLQAEKNTTGYQQQAAKTSVLFNNPYWLQFQLDEKQRSLYPISENPVEVDNEISLPENQESVSLEIIEKTESPVDMEATVINYQEIDETTIESDPVSTYKEELPAQPQETAIDINAEKELESLILDSDLSHVPGTAPEPSPANNNEPLTGENVIVDPENNIDQIITDNEIEPVNDESPFITPPETEKEIITEQVINPENNESAASKEPVNEDAIIDILQSGHFNNDNSPLVNETETEEDPNTEQEIEPLNFKLNIDTSNTTEDRISFEPLHTSDYFASLGIKLSGEIMSSDKLGKQLKSFTEWLKTMKKIHGDQIPQQSGQADISIQKLAELSNIQDAVLTEAMAEVLLQQGKAGKAIEVYGKLSLLNPSKSAYFAAKIDQLKEH